MWASLAVGPYQEDHPVTKPSETLQPLFAVSHSRIFPGVKETLEHSVHLGQIDAMTGKIGFALGLVAGDHAKLYCLTSGKSIKS